MHWVLLYLQIVYCNDVSIIFLIDLKIINYKKKIYFTIKCIFFSKSTSHDLTIDLLIIETRIRFQNNKYDYFSRKFRFKVSFKLFKVINNQIIRYVNKIKRQFQFDTKTSHTSPASINTTILHLANPKITYTHA